MGILSLAVLGLAPLVTAFSFNTSTPTQCGQFTVSWTDGAAPYYLILVPTESVNHGQILNVSIPANATNSYTFTLAEPASLHFLATMYDSTGFGSGGTTNVLQVGSASDTSCLNDNVQGDFTFAINPQTNPAQCSKMSVTWDNDGADNPIALYGLVPHGTAFSLPISQEEDDTSYSWPVDIASGTQFLLFMSDAGRYGTGGSTNLLTVAQGDNSCMNSSSPSVSPTSTAPGPGQTGDSVNGVGGSSGGGSEGGNGNDAGRKSGSSSHTSAGAIAGGVVGGIAFLVLLSLLAFCCVRRRGGSKRDSMMAPAIRSYGVDGEATQVEKHRGSFDILGGLLRRRGSDSTQSDVGETRADDVTGEQYNATPFTCPSPPNTPGSPGTGRRIGHGASGAEAALLARQGYDPFDAPRSPSGAPQLPPVGPFTRSSDETSRASASQPHSRSLAGAAGAGTGMAASSAAGTAIGSNSATLGHVQRQNSTYKHRPGAPSNGSAAVPAVPDTPQERTGPIMQHMDAGSVEELPPRYDQLRARNPDQS